MNKRTLFGFTLVEFALVIAAIVILTLIVVRNTSASVLYPSVAQLQQALNAYPGARIPPQVIANGRVWTGYYVGAVAVGGGRYSVIIQLRDR